MMFKTTRITRICAISRAVNVEVMRVVGRRLPALPATAALEDSDSEVEKMKTLSDAGCSEEDLKRKFGEMCRPIMGRLQAKYDRLNRLGK
jgi:hypothetical protein